MKRKIEIEIVFPNVERADRFHAAIAERPEGNYIEPGSIVHKARTRKVAFVASPPDANHEDEQGREYGEYFQSVREQAGYFGSDSRRKAKATAVCHSVEGGEPWTWGPFPCPMSY